MSEAPALRPAPAAPAAMSSLWRSGLHAFAAGILSILLGIFLHILIARAAGPAGKGNYDLILATSALLGMVLGFSLPAGLTYAVARGRANVRLLAWPLLAFTLGQGALAAAILYALNFTGYARFLLPSPWQAWIIFAVALHLVFTAGTTYLRAILIGSEKIIQVNRREVIGRALHVFALLAVIGIFTIQQHQISAGTLIVFSLATTLLTGAMFFHVVRRSATATFKSSGWKEIWAYAWPCYAGNLAQFLNYRLDVFFVNFFAGATAVGFYALAVTLGQQIWLISASAATVLLPRVAAWQETKTVNPGKIAQAARLTLWCSMLSALLLAVFAKPLLHALFGKAFLPSLPALLWLLPGIVAFSVVNVIASYFAGLGKPRVNLSIALAGLLVTIVLDLVLIPRYGISGAAIASTASYVFSAGLTLVLFTRQSGVGWRLLLLLNRTDVETLRTLISAARKREQPQ